MIFKLQYHCTRVTILTILFTFAQFSAAQDTRIVLANDMIASHHPATGRAKSAVLMIHGWAGQMDEVGDMYKHLAQKLSKQGIASVRINIRGESEREATNYTLTSTFGSRVVDAKTGLDFLHNTYPDLPKGVVGFSLGASTAIALAGNYPKQISSMVLWSAAGNPDTVVESLLSAEQRRQVLETGSVVFQDWEALTITKQHFLGLIGYDIFTPFRAYTGALLCIRGTEDTLPDIDRKIIDTASSELEEYRHISGADHIFDAFNPNAKFSERVLVQTVTWLVDTL